MRQDVSHGPILLSLALLLGATSGCTDGGRLPVCKTDADCAPAEDPKPGDKVEAGAICYNLRCVQCRYDDDCEAGTICNGNLECERLSPAPEKEPVSKPKPMKEPEPPGEDETGDSPE